MPIIDSRRRSRCAICCHCKQRHSQTTWSPWRIRWKFRTICCSTAPT